MMLFFTGRLLAPAYHAEWFVFHHGLVPRLAGVLFSPSGGLLIYMPVVLIPLYLTVRYWRDLQHRPLAMVATAVFISTLIVVVSYPIWWGGWSYGPREFADVVPWLVLVTILGLRAFLDDSLTMRRRRMAVALGIVLVLTSLTMNAPGALSSSATDWNAFVHIGQYTERLCDWQHPPF